VWRARGYHETGFRRYARAVGVVRVSAFEREGVFDASRIEEKTLIGISAWFLVHAGSLDRSSGTDRLGLECFDISNSRWW